MLPYLQHEKEALLKIIVALAALTSPSWAASADDPIYPNRCHIDGSLVSCILHNTTNEVVGEISLELTYMCNQSQDQITQHRKHFAKDGLKPGEMISVSFPIVSEIPADGLTLSNFNISPDL